MAPYTRIFLIPLDSRPVCYDLPRRLAKVAGLELCMPSPKLLGTLKTPGDRKALERWVKNHLFENDPVIVALDTIAYGGLIPGRVNTDPLEALEERVDRFFNQVRASSLFAFSSILRIPAYDNAEEEPDYWAQYGRLLYDYSYGLHQTGKSNKLLSAQIPPEVLDDFLARRHKNHMLNQSYIKRLARDEIQYLTFCQDDTGAYGLNVQEAQELAAILKKQKCTTHGHIQTGADEVASCMLARWMVLNRQQGKKLPLPLRVYPFYSSNDGQKLVARFDGLPIETVVRQAVQACGAELAKKPEEADLWFIVHTPQSKQGDHASNIQARLAPEQTEAVLELFRKAAKKKKPVLLADVAYANGSDPLLTERLLAESKAIDLRGLYGYAGWNTPGNTIGTALAMGVIRYVAEQNGRFDEVEFARLLLIRLADDWLYQSEVRTLIRSGGNGHLLDEGVLNAAMADGLALLKRRLGLEGQRVQCRFPCNRTFEVEIALP